MMHWKLNDLQVLVLQRVLEIACFTPHDRTAMAAFLGCAPKPRRETTLHFHGCLTRKVDRWNIDDTPIVFNCHKLRLSVESLKEPVHLYARPGDVPEVVLMVNESLHRLVEQLPPGNRFDALYRLLHLRTDNRTAVLAFLQDELFAASMVRCFGYLSSAKLDPYVNTRTDRLIEDYRRLHEQVDEYRVLALLDVVGDALELGQDQHPETPLSDWPKLLASYALRQKVTVWGEDGSLMRRVLELPVWIPVYILCRVMLPVEQTLAVRELVKIRALRHKEKVRQMLVGLLAFGSVKSVDVQRALRFLMQEGLREDELAILLKGNAVEEVKQILTSAYGTAF